MQKLINEHEVGKLYFTLEAEFRVSEETAMMCVKLLSLYAKQNKQEAIVTLSPDSKDIENCPESYFFIEDFDRYLESYYKYRRDKEDEKS